MNTEAGTGTFPFGQPPFAGRGVSLVGTGELPISRPTGTESAPARDLPHEAAHLANGFASLMSKAHERLAWDVVGLETPLERLVLLAYARHACENCGLCWPGTVRLELMTIAGRTAIATARRGLIAKGMLRIHAYPRGGRGMSTEMVVLPNDMKLSTAPCGKCVDNLKTNRRAVGFSVDNSGEPVDNS